MNAFVPGYEHDVFISYSHANNHEGWVSQFRQKLDARLKERVPPGANFFRDTDSLQGNDDLTPEIARAIRNSAIVQAACQTHHSQVTRIEQVPL